MVLSGDRVPARLFGTGHDPASAAAALGCVVANLPPGVVRRLPFFLQEHRCFGGKGSQRDKAQFICSLFVLGGVLYLKTHTRPPCNNYEADSRVWEDNCPSGEPLLASLIVGQRVPNPFLELV